MSSQRLFPVPNGHVWLPVAAVLKSSIALLALELTVALRAKPVPAVSVNACSEPKRPSTRSLEFNVVTPVGSTGAGLPPPVHLEV